MFGISGEHLLILGIILIFVGPKRLPELGNTLGKAIRNFKDAMSGVEEAKFRHLGEEPAKPVSSRDSVAASTPQEQPAPAETVAATSDGVPDSTKTPTRS